MKLVEKLREIFIKSQKSNEEKINEYVQEVFAEIEKRAKLFAEVGVKNIEFMLNSSRDLEASYERHTKKNFTKESRDISVPKVYFCKIDYLLKERLEDEGLKVERNIRCNYTEYEIRWK